MGNELNGTLETYSFFSEALGIEKKFRIYLPPDYKSTKREYPAIFLFSTRENDWFDPDADGTRKDRAAHTIADKMIVTGEIKPVILIGVNMSSEDGQIPGLGVDFLAPELASEHDGIGTGKFRSYFIDDLLPEVEKKFRIRKEQKARAAAGFALGGFTAITLALNHPELFGAVASYDGTFMWKDLVDPRTTSERHDDRIWLENELFYPAFKNIETNEPDREYMLRFNASSLIRVADASEIKLYRKIHFYIQCSAFDGTRGNRDRSYHLISGFQKKGILNEAEHIILHSRAMNDWASTDRFFKNALKWYNSIPGEKKVRRRKAGKASNPKLLPNYPNPFDFVTMIPVELKSSALINLRVLDSDNNPVDNILERRLEPGNYSFVWEATGFRPGIYYISLQSGNFETRKKILVLRQY